MSLAEMVQADRCRRPGRRPDHTGGRARRRHQQVRPGVVPVHGHLLRGPDRRGLLQDGFPLRPRAVHLRLLTLAARARRELRARALAGSGRPRPPTSRRAARCLDLPPRAGHAKKRRMPRHEQRADIRLIDGDFYAREPLRRSYAGCARTRRSSATAGGWGIARHDDVLRPSRRTRDLLQRHGMRPDSPPMPYMINMDDPEHQTAARSGQQGLHAAPRGRPRAARPPICRELIARVAGRRAAATSSPTSRPRCR